MTIRDSRSIQDSITSAAGQIIGAGIAKSAEQIKKEQEEAKKQAEIVEKKAINREKYTRNIIRGQNQLMGDKLKEIATGVEEVSPYARLNSTMQGVHTPKPLSNLVVNANKTMEYDPVYSQMATDRIEQGAAQRAIQVEKVYNLMKAKKEEANHAKELKDKMEVLKYGK